MPIDLCNCRDFLGLAAEIVDSYIKDWVHPARARIRYLTARPHGGVDYTVNLQVL